MSSTNRGSKRSPEDYYLTPVAAVRDFLAAFKEDVDLGSSGLALPGTLLDQVEDILDPSAGGDENHPMSYPAAIRGSMVFPNAAIWTIDVREDSLADRKGSYLGINPEQIVIGRKPGVIMTNPPFVMAREFVDKALTDVAPGGLVMMLLRLNFLGSKDRADWWAGQMPALIYVHSKRMSFVPSNPSKAMKRWMEENGIKTRPGETDSIEYAHMVWQSGHHPRFAQMRVIKPVEAQKKLL